MRLYTVIFLALLFSLFGQITFAQSGENNDPCGYDILIDNIEKEYPGYKDAIQSTFDRASRYSDVGLRGEVIIIPVVIHIVYQNLSQNIPKSQILNVLSRLNEDFRHTNKNANNLRQEFADVVGDPMIQFQIKKIIRTSTNSTFKFDLTSFPENVKKSSLGGSDALNPFKNMNIWVCNVQGGGLQGYAYPPVCAPNWPSGHSAPDISQDGIVVDYKSFNTDVTFISQGKVVNIDGRTLTHEVGHYLGLRHIWGDGNCFIDDGVFDTPSQSKASDFDCDQFQNTCVDPGGNDKPDMIENYMDYSDEKCMSAFTKGQINIMRAVLMDCRGALIDTSAIYIPDTLLQQGVLVFPNPTSGEFQIRLNFEEISEITTSIYNGVGQVVSPESINIEYDRITYDISNFPNGVYYVFVDYGAKRGFARKIVLMK